MKKLLILAAAAAMLLFSGCVRENEPALRSDLTAAQLADACLTSVSSAGMLGGADEDYIRFRLFPDETPYESCAVYIQNAGTSIDEIGIVKAKDGDTAALKAAVDDYLTRRNEEWTGQYLVEEYPKLRDADSKVIGDYVVYVILSDSDKNAFYSSVETSLKSAK